jgi:hypothetical protein
MLPSAKFCMQCGQALLSTDSRKRITTDLRLDADVLLAKTLVEPPNHAVSPPAPPRRLTQVKVSTATLPQRRISAGLFGAIIVSFLLPFVLISCENGMEIGMVSGLSLVTGFNMEGEYVQPIPGVVIAFLAAIAGLLVSLVQRRIRLLLASIAGYVGMAFLFLFKVVTDYEASRSAMDIEYKEGFWSALLLFIAAGVYHTVAHAKSRKQQQTPWPTVEA